MVIDTSALIAILRAEEDADRYASAIAESIRCRFSIASYVEAGAVIDRARDPVASRRLDDLLNAASVILEPVTVEQGKVARLAYQDFGKGGGHPAQLNFEDCFSYALAKTTGEPLLFKGDDFIHTDIVPAI